MLIVTGTLRVQPDHRDAFLAGAEPVMQAARATDGCEGFVLATDPLEPDAVVVLERWRDASSLEAFRGSGPSGEVAASILEADVRRYEVARVGPA